MTATTNAFRESRTPAQGVSHELISRNNQMPTRKIFLKCLVIGAALCTALLGTVHAAENATKEEAEAWAKRAVAYIKANGPEKAYAEFNTGSSFKDRDLYVAVYDMNGVALAHGANNKLVGKSLLALKDPNGMEIIKTGVAIAKEKGTGWMAFQFVNPLTKQMQNKESYVERVNDTWVGVGYYK